MIRIKYLFYLLMLCFTFQSTKAQQNLRFWRNGQVINAINIEKIDSITYSTSNDDKLAEVKYVDLGLSVLWASQNVGANKAEELGDCFAWGETKTKESFDINSYRWYDSDSSSYTKYCIYDNLIYLDQDDDAASVNLGLPWHTPTKEQVQELLDNCDYQTGYLMGIEGCWFTSKKNGNSIFLPYNVAGKTIYWSNTLAGNSPFFQDYAIAMSRNSFAMTDEYNMPRYYSGFIRGVRPSNSEEGILSTLKISLDTIRYITKDCIESSIIVFNKNLATPSLYSDMGICWSTSNEAPLISTDSIYSLGKYSLGKINFRLNNLKNNNTYYYRPYITIGNSTIYGKTKNVTVIDGNSNLYVDLGLSVKWGTCNLGANSPEENGNYYAWGETLSKIYYDINTYKWAGNLSGTTLKKYIDNPIFSNDSISDGKTILDSEDDAATKELGLSWRIPSPKEITELRDNCTWLLTKINGKVVYKVTSKINGNSIYFPISSYRYGNHLEKAWCVYWSNSLDKHDNRKSIDFEFGMLGTSDTESYLGYITDGGVIINSTNREYGLPIRPVHP